MSGDLAGISGRSKELIELLGLRNFSKHRDVDGRGNVLLASYGLIASSLTLGIAFLYAVLLSKYMPDTGIMVIDAIKYDHYFCYLIPLLILPTYLAIYLNWLSMKLFQYN